MPSILIVRFAAVDLYERGLAAGRRKHWMLRRVVRRPRSLSNVMGRVDTQVLVP